MKKFPRTTPVPDPGPIKEKELVIDQEAMLVAFTSANIHIVEAINNAQQEQLTLVHEIKNLAKEVADRQSMRVRVQIGRDRAGQISNLIITRE